MIINAQLCFRLLHLTPFQLSHYHPLEDAGSHSQIIYFRTFFFRPSNVSAMHQQGIISCKNIYLSGIVLNHLHGVAPLSIGGVRWLGLGPPAVFESYRSLHTLPSDKLTPSSKNPLSRWPKVNSLHFRLPKNLSRPLVAHNFSPIGYYDSRSFSFYKDTAKKQCLNATLNLASCSLLPQSLVFIIVYI